MRGGTRHKDHRPQVLPGGRSGCREAGGCLLLVRVAVAALGDSREPARGWSWPRGSNKPLALGGGTRLPLPGSPRPGHGAQCSQVPGGPLCAASPGLPRPAVTLGCPHAGSSGPGCVPRHSAGPRALSDCGVLGGLLCTSVVPVVPVSASPASATSGGAHSRGLGCVLCPQCPGVLQLRSDAPAGRHSARAGGVAGRPRRWVLWL